MFFTKAFVALVAIPLVAIATPLVSVLRKCFIGTD